MADGPLQAKAVRQAYNALEQMEVRLLQLGSLVHRIYYKSKAQHRRAKWFQSVDGMRKCFARLLEMERVSCRMEESLPDRGVAAKRRMHKRTRGSEGRKASLEEAKSAVGRVWSSLWGMENNSGV